jgi:hypothetical protein
MLYAVCLGLAFALVMQAWVQVWMEAGIAITTCNSFHLYGADRNCHEAFVRLSTCEVGLNILISGTPMVLSGLVLWAGQPISSACHIQRFRCSFAVASVHKHGTVQLACWKFWRPSGVLTSLDNPL